MVAHTFSCPKGLYFNEITDGCDFLRNVDCGDKDIKEENDEIEEASEEDSDESSDDDSDDEDSKSLKNILRLVKDAGGVEGLEKQIEKEEHAKKIEEDRREKISTKTRSRLTQLLKGRRKEAGLSRTRAQNNLES